MRGDATFTLDVDFGEASRWGVQRYFEEQLAYFDRWLPRRRDRRRRRTRRRCRIFVMGGGSGRKTELGKLDHGGRWRDEQEWPLARAVPTTFHLHGDGSLSTEPRAGGRRAAALHLRPRGPGADDRRQLLRGRRVPAGGRGHGADVDAAAQPGAAAAQHHDPGPRRPGGVARRTSPRGSRAGGSPSAPTCSSTRPSRSPRPVEVTGRGVGQAADRVERRRHRLHREADRRLPAERGLPGRLRHADQRLDHPLPLPQRLRAGGADGAGRGSTR